MFRHHAFTEKRVTCATGNVLTYYRRDGLPASPTLVFEAGLMSTSTSWLLLADHLAPTLSVVVYDRAGYRKSMRGCVEPYCLSESVDDLRDVIADAVISDGPVYLVGHSLGGYLAYQVATTASRTTESRVSAPAIDGVVLIDPTHPGELMRSRRQREGSRGVHMALKLGPLTSLAGGGLLMDKKNMYAFCAGSPYEKLWRLENRPSAPGWPPVESGGKHTYSCWTVGASCTELPCRSPSSQRRRLSGPSKSSGRSTTNTYPSVLEAT